jgi:hypothetical protein
MKEKIILSIIAAFLGLLVAGGAFYIYQMTRSFDEPKTNIAETKQAQPTTTAQSSHFLLVENPKDEEVTDKRTITVSGKTTPGATIVVSTESSDQVVKPSASGDFTLTHTIDDGIGIVHITAIFENGEEQTVTRTVSYTTEEF